MRTIWKMALGAVSLGLLAACQPYDGYYADGYSGGYGYGYCDSFGCPDNYWDQPLYYGSVYYGGRWNNGPFYYRDFNGGRQYWLGGGWRSDGWRGVRPPQYRDGRYGPALGRDWYRNNRPGRPGFNRPDRPRGQFNRPDRGAQQPQTPRPDRFQRDRTPQQPQGGGERRGGRFGGGR